MSEPDSAVSQISISAILSRTWDIFRRRMPLFVGLMLAYQIPIALATEFLPKTTTIVVVDYLLSLICASAIQGFITYAAFQTLTGAPVSLGETLSRAMPRVVSLALMALLSTAVLLLGVLCLLVPAVMLCCVWSVAVPVCIVERLSPVSSLNRSAELTDGHRWRILGLFLLFIVAVILCCIPSVMIMTASSESAMIMRMVTSVALAFPLAFQNVMCVVIYSTLRTIREGAANDNLAGVFA